MKRKALFIGSAVALALAFVGAALLYDADKTQRTAQAVARHQENLVRFHSPTLGDSASKVHIVEFLDPACETCRAMYPHVKQIMVANPDRVRLSIRHVPFHPGSDQVVKALVATSKQGRYWQALEALLAAQPQWVINHTAHLDLAWKSFEGLGLDLARLRVDMDAPDVAQQVALDLADAKSLNVTKTPEYFVNGRPLPSFGLQQLQDVVREELRSSYR